MSSLDRLVRLVRENPFLLSHHPRCRSYDHHTLTVRGHDLCLGCFVVYPIGGVTLAGLLVLWLLAPGSPLFGLSTTGLYAVGGALAAPLVVSKALPGPRSVRTRLVAKALLAAGLAVGLLSLVVRPADRLRALVLVGGGLAACVGDKAATAFDDCDGCPEHGSFPDCPGPDFDHAPCDGCSACAIPSRGADADEPGWAFTPSTLGNHTWDRVAAGVLYPLVETGTDVAAVEAGLADGWVRPEHGAGFVDQLVAFTPTGRRRSPARATTCQTARRSSASSTAPRASTGRSRDGRTS